ncbi:InlB B-repeat-containing protein [Treponema zioleckii]|uniref:InlB B-repeat-containing protein n=1 Tax=Treponema zioleckii TaxID=331680 RepID=UPI00168B0456|nr:InlB B-repeat-containing protein [Treponema zioleckii]
MVALTILLQRKSQEKNNETELVVSDKGYNIIFDKNDGSGEKIVENYDTDSKTVIQVDVYKARFTREGYTLLGYSKHPESTFRILLKFFIKTDSSGEKGKETWYAIWQKNDEFKVNYYFSSDFSDGEAPKKIVGTFPVDKKSGKAEVKYAECPWTKDGYVFAGWSDDFGEVYPLTTEKINGDENRTACWVPVEKINELYKITYHANNGTDEKIERYYKSGAYQDCIISDCSFEYENKYFNGWGLSADATYGWRANENYEPKNHNTDLYAIWGNLVTITFNANDGSASPATKIQQVKESHSESLEENTFTREGYLFGGWAKSADAASALYKDKNSVSLSSDIVLYAVWCAPCKITFNVNDGSENPKTYEQTLPAGVKTWINPKLPEEDNAKLEDYTFCGWSTDATKTYNEKEKWDNFSITKDTTYYGVWVKKPVITLHANYEGAAPESSQMKVEYKEELKNSKLKDIFKREGKVLYGWSEFSESKYPQYYCYGNNSDRGLVPTKDSDLYAIWRNEKLTITFNANDGSANPATKTQQADFGERYVELDENTFVRDGYTFQGWDTSEDSRTPWYSIDPSGVITLSSNFYDDITLYAIWKKN